MFRKVFVSLTLITSLVFSAASTADEAPRNLIMVIGDGMGFPYLSAYRYYKDGRGMTDQADMERTIFDRYLVGAASTYPADDTLVTDSAASATALATGHKTYNGAIGVNRDEEPLKNMMEYANERGFLTGAIATTRVTHATPASFFAHVPQRRMEERIAKQYATRNEAGEWKFDLMLGSGREYFSEHIDDFQAGGMRVIESFEELKTQQRLPLLGLFHERDFPYVIDDEKRLRSMVEESLRLLENADQPFVIMIEAAMIDWCGHGNDIGCAMHEMAELDDMLQFLISYVEERGDTALVVTADHSTGGLTLGADGEYQFRAGQVRRIGRALRTMATELKDMPRIDWDDYIEQYLPFPLSTEQQEELERVAAYDGDNRRNEITQMLHDIVRYHTRAGWTTSGHTGEDVPVIAAGRWANFFSGVQDQTDIAKQYIEWIKEREVAESE